jgi:hypothetical protein
VVESFSEVENSPHTDIHFGDTQDLQVLRDHSVKLSQFLAMNRDVLQEIHRILDHIWKDSHAQGKELFTSSLIVNVNEQIRRLETVLRRLEGSFELVRISKHSGDLTKYHAGACNLRLQVSGESAVQQQEDDGNDSSCSEREYDRARLKREGI